MRVAVTGATGFIGSALLPTLTAAGHDPVALPREFYAPVMLGADAVIHLAGLAHRSGRKAPLPGAFEVANAELPLAVQEAARAAGVPQMIQVSTIAVLGGNAGPLREDSPLAPTTPYDRAKAKAETALLAAGAAPALTILRPPLVYGPGAKGNLAALLRLCRTPLPLPFGAVRNRRSMVGLGNLVSALLFLLDHPGQGIVHVTDNRDLSLPEIVTAIRAGFGRPPNLLSLPPDLIRAALSATGRVRMADQLLGDQIVEMEKLPALGWSPPNSPEVDLHRMAEAYAATAAADFRGSP